MEKSGTKLKLHLAFLVFIIAVETFLEVIAGITQVMIKSRDKEIRNEKLNMIVGLFFSEIGTRLLKSLAEAGQSPNSVVQELSISADWTDQQSQNDIDELSQVSYQVDTDRIALEELQEFLPKKRRPSA